MRRWTHDHTTWLIRSLSPPSRNSSSSFSPAMEGNINPNPNPNLIINEDNDPRPLRECWNPTRNVQPYCIVLPPTNANHFEIKPGVINMLPKFSGTEDPYLFIREFEEVCVTLKLQQLNDDSIRLRLITFALRDNAK